MVIYNLPNGDKVHRFDSNIVIPFEGARRVLSTEPHNGGCREDIKTVYNHDGRASLGVKCQMKGNTHKEHQMCTMEEMGFDVDTTVGMETAAFMRNASIVEEKHGSLSVTAIVTGGIETNGGRVGDIASYDEEESKKPDEKLGTINIILYVNADLPEGTMARALVTCTEAKTAAVQELLAPSRYSRGIATGSGTDSTIVVSNMESSLHLSNAGKHSKLGELIGKAVKQAVKEALALQTDLTPKSQYNAIKRLERFDVNENMIYKVYLDGKSEDEDIISRPEFSKRLEEIVVKREQVSLASLLAHLIDQMDWDLLSLEDVILEGENILNNLVDVSEEIQVLNSSDKDSGVCNLIDAWSQMIIDQVENSK